MTLAGEFAPIDAIAGALKNRMYIGAGGTLLEIPAVTLWRKLKIPGWGGVMIGAD